MKAYRVERTEKDKVVEYSHFLKEEDAQKCAREMYIVLTTYPDLFDWDNSNVTVKEITVHE